MTRGSQEPNSVFSLRSNGFVLIQGSQLVYRTSLLQITRTDCIKHRCPAPRFAHNGSGCIHAQVHIQPHSAVCSAPCTRHCHPHQHQPSPPGAVRTKCRRSGGRAKHSWIQTPAQWGAVCLQACHNQGQFPYVYVRLIIVTMVKWGCAGQAAKRSDRDRDRAWDRQQDRAFEALVSVQGMYGAQESQTEGLPLLSRLASLLSQAWASLCPALPRGAPGGQEARDQKVKARRCSETGNSRGPKLAAHRLYRA